MADSAKRIYKLKSSQFSRLCQLKMNQEEITRCIRVLWNNIKSEKECEAIEKYIYLPNLNKNGEWKFPFIPSPSVILLRARDVNSVEIRLISFRNDDITPHSILIAPLENPSFKIISPLNYRQKVAPGMCLIYQLRFEVSTCEDCYTEIKCSANGKLMIIPVFGIGPRAYLDFPDSITIPTCPVKYVITKTLIVRNIGERVSRFTLSTLKKKSFGVKPEQCELPINSTLQIEIEFNPQHEGEINDELVILYQTGERVYSKLQGVSENVNIRLEKNTLPLYSTFIGLKSVRQISLINSSDISCHFRWTEFSTREEEECVLREKSLVTVNKTLSSIEDFSNAIQIEPMEGDVWQKTSQSFNVVFAPENDTHYEMLMYCDVIGREMRLPLKIIGDGKGPTISFVTSKLDVGKLLVGIEKSFEAIFKNDGLISATYHLRPSKSSFGRFFKFIPESDVIKPTKTQVLNVTIHCLMLGDFYEEFLFDIDKNEVPVKLIINGSCIGPTLAFESRKINLGHVAFGYSTKKVIDLENKSLIPVRFHLRVIEDTSETNNLCEAESRKFENALLFDTILGKTSEFKVKPETSKIDPLNSIKIEMTLVAQYVKHYKYYLIVDIQGIGKAVTSVSILAKSEIPKLSIVDNSITFERCFLDLAYEQTIHLKNDSVVPAVYHIKPQMTSTENLNNIKYESSKPEGVIAPLSISSIPISITPKSIGVLHDILSISVTGQSGAHLSVPINCTACGPVVDVQPEFMDWGLVPVLQLTSKTIQIINLCPIAARFTASMVNLNSVWKLDPTSGNVLPNSTYEINIYAYFQDTQKFQDKVIIKILHSVIYQIPVWVKTFGTTIGIEPPISNPLILSPHFSNVILEKKFIIINHGRKSQQLYWSSETVRREKSSSEVVSASLFHLIPAMMELSPGQSMEFTLQALSDRPQKIMEIFSCHGTKGRTKNKEMVMQFELHAEFIAPSLRYSTSELTFKVCKERNKELENLVTPLAVTNVSALPLTVNVEVTYPFQVVLNGNVFASQANIVIPVGHNAEILINFDPNYINDKVMRSVKEELRVSFSEHPQVDIIPLTGFVYFANLLFDKTDIVFDIMPFGLEWRQTLTMCNTSPFQVYYEWCIFITSFDSSDIASPMDCRKFLSIVPMQGVLRPEDEQEVTFLFNAESKVFLEGVAVCKVDDGPSYPVRFSARAAQMSFDLYPTYISVGNQVFNEVINVKFTLSNTGDVGFKFSGRSYPLDDDDDVAVEKNYHLYNFSMLIPKEGFVDAHSTQVLNIKILPAYPWCFKYEVLLDIAHFAPSLVTVVGHSVFPFIGVCVDEILLSKSPNAYDMQSGVRLMKEVETCITRCLQDMRKDEMSESECDFRLAKSTLNHCFGGYKFAELHIEFGFVILGSVISKNICVFNRSNLPISFKLEVDKLNSSGFFTDIDQVKQLPSLNSVCFLLTFNPFTANIPVGDHTVQTYIKISNGIPSSLILHAVVTKPNMKLSADVIEFGEVQCSHCKIYTIQLHNDGFVTCEWECILKKPKQLKGRKLKHHGILNPVFWVYPPTGLLRPREKMNLEIHFIPHEDKTYTEKLIFKLRRSSIIPSVIVKGVGIDPNIILRPQMIIFDPVLPNSRGCVKDVLIENPCNFPLEVYSVEFDNQFKQEDTFLRLLPDYDEWDSVLIPVRHPGENLSSEFNKYFAEIIPKTREFLNKYVSTWQTRISSHEIITERSESNSDESNNTILIEAEAIENCHFDDEKKTFIYKMNYLLQANERALLELSPENQEKLISMVHQFYYEIAILGSQEIAIESPVRTSMNNYLSSIKFPNGFVEESSNYLTIVISGPPKTDDLQTTLMAAIAEYYKTKAVTVDTLIQEAIISGNSNAAVAAREICRKKATEANTRIVKHVSRVQKDGTVIVISVIQEESPNQAKNVLMMKVGDEEIPPTILPSSILSEVISEQVQVKGYETGLILAGLDCKFSSNIKETITTLLNAFSKKKHLYFISLHKTLSSIKETEMKSKMEEILESKRLLKDEVKRIEDMSEDEYDNLSIGKKAEVNRIIDIMKQEWFSNKKTTTRDRRISQVVEKLKNRKTLLEKMNIKLQTEDVSASNFDNQSLIEEFEDYEKNFAGLLEALENYKTSSATSFKEQEDFDTDYKINDQTSTHTNTNICDPIASSGFPHIIADISGVKDISNTIDTVLATLPTDEEIQEELRSLRSNVYCPPPYLLSAIMFPFQTRLPTPSNRFDFVGHSIIRGNSDSQQESNETCESAEDEKYDLLSPLQSKRERSETTRWVIPPHSQLILSIRFQSAEMGQFDRILHFELLGCRRRYQLFCRGTCRLPDIHREPSALFNTVKKSKRENEIVDKVYILDTKTFEFGSLLLGKTGIINDSLRNQNTTLWNIVNTSGMTVDITFSLAKGIVYHLEPTSMTIPHGCGEKLKVCALPMEEGEFEDEVTFQIQDNPDTVRVVVFCVGAYPAIELEPNEISFERVLLHRREFRSTKIINTSLLPIYWKLNPLNCGDEFIFPVSNGVLSPESTSVIKIGFQSPVSITSLNSVNIEVYDINSSLGLMQTEVLTLSGEAYDVTVDIIFPKGSQENVLDFGYVRVREEVKLTVSLKNKGKYDILYKFVFLKSAVENMDSHKLLTISPIEGKLSSNDRSPTIVQFSVKCKKELLISDVPLAMCKLVEPNVQSQSNGVVAEIPIRVTLKALYSRYKVRPDNGVNFGPLVVGNKANQTFHIGNTGPFNFTFEIYNEHRDLTLKEEKLQHSQKATKGSDDLKLILDKFTVYPHTGIVLMGQETAVEVECLTEQPGKFKTIIVVNIGHTDTLRDIFYPIIAEVCVPSFESKNLAIIFEEHPICQTEEEAKYLLKTDVIGVYCQSQSLFIFKDTMLDTSIEAHFKIYNDGKVPSDIVATLTQSKRLENIVATSFSIQPSQSTIYPFDHIFLTVIFKPKQLQKYESLLQVSLANPWSETEESTIAFTVCGEGVLPLISIIKPACQNDSYCLTFSQLLVGEVQELSFQIKNISAVLSTITMELFDPSGCFWASPHSPELRDVSSDNAIAKDYDPSLTSNAEMEEPTMPEKGTTFTLQPSQTGEFDVFFVPNANKKYSASIHFDVWGNYFDKPMLSLMGEGCDAELVIKVQNDAHFEETDDSTCWKQPRRFNFLDLGHCHVNETYTRTISMINKSLSVARFEWANSDLLHFSPQIAHVKEMSQKDVTVTFQCEIPTAVTRTKIECNVCKIYLLEAKQELDYWDDRKKIVKWIKVLVENEEEEFEELEESDTSEKPKEYIEKRKIETEQEPEFEITPQSEQTLELLVHVQTAYCTYSLDTYELNFEETYVFDSRYLNVCMENTGTITLEGKWMVKVRIDKKSSIEMPMPHAYSKEYLNSTDAPISITPANISIKANSRQTFQVKFAPLYVESFEGIILANLSNLLPNSRDAKIKVTARSLLPYCHFKIEASDYLSENRRERQLRVPPGILLDNSIKVIEIDVSGIAMEILKSFTVVNPTNTDYSYHWQKLEPHSDDFVCLTPSGNLHAGMSTQASFKFRSRVIGVTESFWKLNLPTVNTVVPFLIIGVVREPEVFASCSSLSIGPLLKGQSHETSFELLNHNDLRMDFAFDPETCYTSGRQMLLQIYPMNGAIPPNSKNHVRVNFKAIAAGNFNFTLFCNLPKRSTPIKVNVKVTVYEMKLLVYSTTSTERVEMHPNKPCKMDLGKINIGEMFSTNVVIVNSGDVGFEYKWNIHIRNNRSSDLTPSISPDSGYVKTNDSENCVVHVKPNIECRIEGVDFKLRILGGPSYILSVSGESELPGVAFSSSTVDFGSCFSNISSQEKVVTLTNTHRKALSVQCLYTSTNSLAVHFETAVLAPQESKNIQFIFTPHAIKNYEEKVAFLINSHITKIVTVHGEGIEIKVAVTNFHDKTIKFGALRIGDMQRKTIVVVNSSKASIYRPSFQLSLDSASAEVRDSLTVSGKCTLALDAMRGQCSVDIVFAPKHRVPNFKVGLIFVSEYTRIPISVITGSCKALEVSLLDSIILFGAVVENTTVERKLLMNNTGDYGTRFHWDEFKFFPDFSIYPTSGYITPDSQMSFTISFHPIKMNQEIKRDSLKCYLEQGQVLSISLLGSCIEVPANAKLINFSTPVRKTDRQEIIITNDTSEMWKLHPKINGEFWNMAPVLVIGGNETKHFDVLYFPTTMTRDQMHQGSIFILLPNGSHLAYNLIGHSLPPTVMSVITRDIQCRTEFVELLTLENWFPTSHRFKVLIEKEDKSNSNSSTIVQGTSFLDILGKKKKDYKLRFLAYKEDVVPIKVTFLSEETGEYEFYELIYKTYKAGPEDSLELISTLRSTFRRNVVIKNPLKEAVIFTVTCDLREVQVPSSLTVDAESEIRMTVEFTPLHIGEDYGWIELNSPDLGVFEYEIMTKCTHVAPEKTVMISTFIGVLCTTLVRIANPFPDQKFEILVKIDNPDFQVEKPILSISPGASEIVFDLIFDPSVLGEIKANVILTSATTGDFVIPILGTGVPPKAQGPIPLKFGIQHFITLRNPFVFNLILETIVDNPQFSIAPYPEVLKSRKDVKLVVTFDPYPNSVTENASGKLMVNAIREDTGVSTVHWIFYLQGSK